MHTISFRLSFYFYRALVLSVFSERILFRSDHRPITWRPQWGQKIIPSEEIVLKTLLQPWIFGSSWKFKEWYDSTSNYRGSALQKRILSGLVLTSAAVKVKEISLPDFSLTWMENVMRSSKEAGENSCGRGKRRPLYWRNQYIYKYFISNTLKVSTLINVASCFVSSTFMCSILR